MPNVAIGHSAKSFARRVCRLANAAGRRRRYAGDVILAVAFTAFFVLVGAWMALPTPAPGETAGAGREA